MKRRLFTTVALVCCFLVCLAVIDDMQGKWSGVIKTGDGNELSVVYVFKIDGEKLTGTAQGQSDPRPITDGKIINGTDFTFNVTNPAGMVFHHSGKYYGDSVGVDIETNGMKFHTTLKRDAK
jgi:hypothetical protein